MFALVELSSSKNTESSSKSPPAHVSSRSVEERDSQNNKFKIKSESVLVGSPSSSSAFVLGSGGDAQNQKSGSDRERQPLQAAQTVERLG